MPKGFTEHEKELIGQRLLEQGYRLFSAYGLKKTNIEEIARAAGISKGAYYNFYEFAWSTATRGTIDRRSARASCPGGG